ncbi:MAG: phage minor head protein [Negativibacillus sp.]
MNGYMSESTFSQWQQDYSKMVSDKLAPVWVKAMETASLGVQDKHDSFFFDHTWPGVTNWVKDHGAEFVTNINTEQKNAVSALIARAYSKGESAEELSRAIRPCIGLTQRQAIANANYYDHVKESLLKNNPGMKDATAAKKAQEAAAKYAAQQHRYRANMIAETEMAFAYQHGEYEAVKMAQAQGLMGVVEKVWSTAYDDGVCDICNSLEGQTIGIDDDFNFKLNKLLFQGQRLTPPAHPQCRCAVEYREITPPVIQPTQNQAQGPNIPDPAAPSIPGSLQMPQGMKDKGPAHLGGTGEMHLCEDSSGTEWLFKPAQSKGGTPEEFRAYVQEAGYKVQSIVDPETAVKVGTGNIGGKFGAYQQKIDVDPAGFDFKAWQQYGTKGLTADQVQQIQREHVTDWLLGNYDSHGGNFVTDSAGRLIGVDKEQSFRYIADKASGKMTYAYHPNSKYGETEPLYNTVFRKYAKNELDLNPQDTLAYIKRVEAIPDKEYREIFRGYAESLKGKGKDAEQLLDAIVERKQNIRETYRTFYTDLLTERTGKKQAAFVWADEAQNTAKTIQAAVHDVASLKKMGKADLLQMAKAQNIAYCNNMNKQQLIDSLSDPVKAKQCSKDVRDRLAANQAARNAKPAPKPPAQTNTGHLPVGTKTADDVFSDFGKIHPGQKQGQAVWSDADKVEGMNLNARRMIIDGDVHYEITGKLRASTWDEVLQRMDGANATVPSKRINMVFETTSPTSRAWTSNTQVGIYENIHGVITSLDPYDTKYASFELYSGKAQGLHCWDGYFRIRVRSSGDGVADAKKATDLLKLVGLDDVAKTPTAAAEETLKKARLVWSQAPGRVDELKNLAGNSLVRKLDDIIAQENINVAQLASMELRKEYNGYITYAVPGLAKDLEKAGAKYVYHSVCREGDVLKILESGGISSTMSRIKQGIERPAGASMSADMRTGGADSAFTRIATGQAQRMKRKFSGASVYGDYQIKMSTEVLERTDYYAFEGDMFGEVQRISSRGKSPLQFVKDMESNFQGSNEIMFRNGIDSRYFTEIMCSSRQERQHLLSELQARGIMDINGIDIDKFITVGSGL